MDPEQLQQQQEQPLQEQAALPPQAEAFMQHLMQRVAGLEQQVHEQQQHLQAMPPQAPPLPPAGPSTKFSPAKPDKYNGALGKSDQWCFEIEEYFKCCNIQDPQRVPYAGAMLTGNAALWWRSVCQETSNPITTWAQFKADLIYNFKHIDDVKLARDRLRALRQRTSVAAFYADFTRAIFQIPGITEEEKMDRFFAGLKPSLQREIVLREPATFADLTKMASKLDSILYSTERRSLLANNLGRSGRFTSYRAGNYGNQGGGAAPMELGAVQIGPSTSNSSSLRPRNQLTPAERDKLRREGRCFYCKELGHIAERCPRKRGNEKKAGKAWVR